MDRKHGPPSTRFLGRIILVIIIHQSRQWIVTVRVVVVITTIVVVGTAIATTAIVIVITGILALVSVIAAVVVRWLCKGTLRVKWCRSEIRALRYHGKTYLNRPPRHRNSSRLLEI